MLWLAVQFSSSSSPSLLTSPAQLATMHVIAILPLVLSSLLGTSAVNPCLDPTDPGYMCVAGDYGYINLHGCGITDDDVDVGDLAACFDDVGRKNIVTLYLSNNELTALPEDVFEGLTSLGPLYLGSNALTALPAGIFQGLTSLGAVELPFNALTTLPEGIFPSGLVWIILAGNDFTTLPAGIFQDAGPTLRHLYLNANGLTTLPAGIFQGLTALRMLYLQMNDLTTLPAGIFQDLTSLEYIGLFENALECLPEVTLLELDDGETSLSDGYENGIDVGTYGAECGCSIADLCGQEACTPGPVGYTCGPASSTTTPEPAPESTPAPESSSEAAEPEAPASSTTTPEPTLELTMTPELSSEEFLSKQRASSQPLAPVPAPAPTAKSSAPSSTSTTSPESVSRSTLAPDLSSEVSPAPTPGSATLAPESAAGGGSASEGTPPPADPSMDNERTTPSDTSSALTDFWVAIASGVVLIVIGGVMACFRRALLDFAKRALARCRGGDEDGSHPSEIS